MQGKSYHKSEDAHSFQAPSKMQICSINQIKMEFHTMYFRFHFIGLLQRFDFWVIILLLTHSATAACQTGRVHWVLVVMVDIPSQRHGILQGRWMSRHS